MDILANGRAGDRPLGEAAKQCLWIGTIAQIILMMRSFIRLLRRLLILGIGAFSVWLITFVIFPIADNRLPWILCAALASIAAYIICAPCA